MFKKEEGFTLVEILISTVVFSLLLSATLGFLSYQHFSLNRLEEVSKMDNELRIAAFQLTKDVREASRIQQLGNEAENDGLGLGPGIGNALKIVKKINGVDKVISYYYRDTGKTRYVLFRDVGGYLYPLTSEYSFGGINRGYLRSWSIKCYNSEGTEITDQDRVNEVNRIDVTLRGSYRNRDNQSDYKILRTTSSIRVLATQ